MVRQVKKSINKKLANFAANAVEGAEVNLIDLNDFHLPMYSIDEEIEKGFPEDLTKLVSLVKDSDGIVFSLAEHNGNYTVAMKNVIDWVSRLDLKAWNEKNLFILSTSPGPRGASSVLDIAKKSFPFFGSKSNFKFFITSI